jgi:hypothetical protein
MRFAMSNDKEVFAGYIGDAALYIKEPQEKQSEPVAKVVWEGCLKHIRECSDVVLQDGQLLYTTPQTKQLSESLVFEMAQAFGVEKRLIRLIEAKIIGEYK